MAEDEERPALDTPTSPDADVHPERRSECMPADFKHARHRCCARSSQSFRCRTCCNCPGSDACRHPEFVFYRQAS
jgi:hypothetical protein